MESRVVILHLFLAAAAVPVLAEIEMEFTKFPESVTAPVGDNVTFECAVRVPGEKLTWRWRPINGAEDRWKEVVGTSDREKITTRLVVEITDSTPNSFYQCIVSYGSVSLASIPARLSIARIDTTKNSPEKRVITAPLHNTIVLHCKEPLSDPPAVLTWWKESNKGIKKQLDTPHGVLVIHNATTEDSGTYGCTATNELSGQVVNLPEKTYLKVQHEGNGGVRFLETQDYVGKLEDGVLTASVKVNAALRIWCGAVGTPPPRVSWSREPRAVSQHGHVLLLDHFTKQDEGVYSCSVNGLRRSWKVVALEPPTWEGSAVNINASEGGSAHIACGTAVGQPTPTVHWLLNAEPLKSGKIIKPTGSDLHIERVEKRHAGIVQCFACNTLGCAYDAALLTVVPVQISDQEYPPAAKVYTQPPKRHNRKNSRKHKGVMVPPSRPNVTRMSDESVMVSWSNANHGLTIQFFKVQYKEATDPNAPWYTATHDIPPHIHSYYVDGLHPDRYYKFRIAAVYSNQDNKLGRISNKFYLQRGGFQSPRAPVLTSAKALSSESIQLNWTWSSGGGIEAEGFYVYYRAVSSAGEYEKVTAPSGGAARSVTLAHLVPDTAYELKVQAYTAQAPSEFTSILKAKTHRAANSTQSSSTEASEKAAAGGDGGAGGGRALVTAGGALGATVLLVLLVVTLLLCRRAKRPHEEKGSAESAGANGYIPAKVPITITANPMHAEGTDGGVEMSFLHNNNCGNTGGSDDTLPHSRKNGPSTRQYV